MAESRTLTVRLPAEVKDQLGVLADRTRRTRSFLAGEAIGAFVRREMEIVAGIERGLEDFRAGRVVSRILHGRGAIGRRPISTTNSTNVTNKQRPWREARALLSV